MTDLKLVEIAAQLGNLIVEIFILYFKLNLQKSVKYVRGRICQKFLLLWACTIVQRL